MSSVIRSESYAHTYMYGRTQEIFTPVVLSGEERMCSAQIAFYIVGKAAFSKQKRYAYRRAGIFPGVAEIGHLAKRDAVFNW